MRSRRDFAIVELYPIPPPALKVELPLNTPTHAVLNLCLLGRRGDPHAVAPILAGAVVPDAAMFVFYAVERGLLGTPDSVIWSSTYFEPGWQNVFDVWNSIPLIAVALAIAWWRGSRTGVLFCVSMLLHVALDFPLHNDDAHRHFFPFSDWRFTSPVSYWDPSYYGHITAPLEALMGVLGCCWLGRRHTGRGARVALALLALLYGLGGVAMLVFWI